jgi:hypothetical protein
MQDPTITNTSVSPWNGSSSSQREDLKTHGLPLPGYGRAYLNLLIAEFKSLRDVCVDEKAKDLAQEVISNAEAGETMTWGDAYMLDTAIAQMLPTEYLHQRAWCLEVKYRDAVGNADAYDAFKKDESPHLVGEKDDHLRARIQNMIRELYRLYTVIDCRENMREEISESSRKTLFIVFVVLAGFWIVEFVLHSLHYDNLANSFDYGGVWGLVFTAGAIGGVLSLQRRLQSLPRHGESLSDLVELSGRMTVKFSPIIGGIFAIVLFLLFASGLVQGDLFPQVASRDGVANFVAFIGKVPPTSVIDWGKLLVWSFIAGFAERLVPDTLDNLIARSEQGKNKNP